MDEVAFNLVEQINPEKKVTLREYPWEDININMKAVFNIDKLLSAEECSKETQGDIYEYFKKAANEALNNKFKSFEAEQVKYTNREVLLATFDQFWKDHLLAMDHLKEGINLRSYGQKDPLVEYKREAFTLYESMKDAIKRAVIERISHIKLLTKEEIDEIHKQQEAMLDAQMKAHQQAEQSKQMEDEKRIIRASVKVGRNDPCPCGSGKKFKACHGA